MSMNVSRIIVIWVVLYALGKKFAIMVLYK